MNVEKEKKLIGRMKFKMARCLRGFAYKSKEGIAKFESGNIYPVVGWNNGLHIIGVDDKGNPVDVLVSNIEDAYMGGMHIKYALVNNELGAYFRLADDIRIYQYKTKKGLENYKKKFEDINNGGSTT